MRALSSLVFLPVAVAAAACAGGAAAGRAPPPPPPEVEALLDAPIEAQREAIAAGAVDGAVLASGYRHRIATLDDADGGPHAILRVDPRAAQRSPQDGPLAGVVVVVKDNIDTKDLPTTAGSRALADHRPRADAAVITRLRRAGAIVLGKANLSEWANVRSARSVSGWSSLGGQTVNAVAPGRSPCGSSAGSAAAVAAGLAAAAVGTETDGSLVCPASVHGIVAFKPSVGLVSRAGIIPVAPSQDTAGPMTRTVSGAARLLAAMAGPDPADPATSDIPSGLSLDFASGLDSASLDGVRLGLVTSMTGYHGGLDGIFEEAVGRLRSAGATIVTVELPRREDYGAQELVVILHELKAGLDAYLAKRPSAPRSLDELIAYNIEHKDTMMPHFGQDLFQIAARTGGLDDPAYLEAKADLQRRLGPEGIDALLAEHELDALIAPTNPPAWPIDYAGGDRVSGGASGPAAIAGGPHLTLPMGRVDARPVGISVFGAKWSDRRVLEVGRAVEKALGGD